MVRFIIELKIVDLLIKCRVIDRNIHAGMYVSISSKNIWLIIAYIWERDIRLQKYESEIFVYYKMGDSYNEGNTSKTFTTINNTGTIEMTDHSSNLIKSLGSVSSSNPRSSEFSEYNMLARQKDIMRAIFYLPSVLAKYIHYRGSAPVEFRGVSIPIPPPPFIPYNDSNICCILDKIEGLEDTIEACRPLTVTALGPKGKIGIPYIIKSDNETDLVVKLSKVDDVYSRYHVDPPTSLREIDSFGIKQCISKVKLSKIRYLASDEFTNETLIAYTLNLVAEESVDSSGTPLPRLFVKHYQGAICSNSTTGETFGLNIMENCDLGSLDKISQQSNFAKYFKEYNVNDNGREILGFLVDPDIIFQILTQITVGLHMLQNYAGFVSGDLKAGNVFVKSESIDTQYMGIKLKGDFICKIADYGKSSCMLPRLNGTSLRFYNESALANLYLKVHPFTTDITSQDNDYYYSIGNLLTSQIYPRTRHMGVPFFRSFDYYTVLVSLLTDPSFYYMFFSNDKLRSTFWDPIWADNFDSEEVIRRVRQLVIEGKGKSITEAIAILKGLRLKCGAVNLVMTKILLNQ